MYYNVFIIVLIFFAVIVLSSAIRILREYERGVVFRLGRVLDKVQKDLD